MCLIVSLISFTPSLILVLTSTTSLWIPGFDENLAVQGELILQDTFQVWDPKSLIRKGRDRHLFLFEISLVFSKEMKDSSGRTKYVYKSKLLVGCAENQMFDVIPQLLNSRFLLVRRCRQEFWLKFRSSALLKYAIMHVVT